MDIMTIVVAVIAVLIACGDTWVISDNYHRNVASKKVGSAEDKARQIIDDAVKASETTKREAELEDTKAVTVRRRAKKQAK